MTAPLHAFLDLLARELRLHEGMLALVREEQGVLVRGDADDLGRVIRAQEEIALQIRSAEATRLSLLADYAEVLRKEPTDITIDDLLSLADAETAARLRALQRDLATTLRTLVDANRTNAVLIRDHLGYIRNVIDIVTRTFSTATYGPGEPSGAPVSLLVDRVT